ncbi:MAG: hypothetical protein ACR2HF_09170 [Methylococcaceae bacterium]
MSIHHLIPPGQIIRPGPLLYFRRSAAHYLPLPEFPRTPSTHCGASM